MMTLRGSSSTAVTVRLRLRTIVVSGPRSRTLMPTPTRVPESRRDSERVVVERVVAEPVVVWADGDDCVDWPDADWPELPDWPLD